MRVAASELGKERVSTLWFFAGIRVYSCSPARETFRSSWLRISTEGQNPSRSARLALPYSNYRLAWGYAPGMGSDRKQALKARFKSSRLILDPKHIACRNRPDV